MKRLSKGGRVRSSLWSAALILVAASQFSAFPQRGGTAANGGSVLRERPDTNSGRSNIDLQQYYKDVAAILRLDYNRVLIDYAAGRSTARPPTLKKVVLAHLLSREIASGDPQVASLLSRASTSDKKLEQAIRQVINVPAETAHQYALAAKKDLKAAEHQSKANRRR